ncbi:hypothetical protein [Streptomyces mirabilis]|uniref:hypothetical protein n=1 Tax=Streptomyces mirabilis TaxID=68239 RepID=UPI0033B806EB
MRQTSELPRDKTRTIAALRSILGAAVLFSGMSACSGDDSGKEESRLTASQVCASTLDSSAATALQRMGNTDKFTASGTDPFSLKQAADTIHDARTRQNQCWVFKAGDKTGHPLIAVNFSAATYDPSLDASTDDGKSKRASYPIGVYAKTDGKTSATLYFKCPSVKPGEAKYSTPHVKAYLYSTPDQVSAKATGRDLMTILNAISRGMAKQLGCASQAALPSKVPAAKAG